MDEPLNVSDRLVTIYGGSGFVGRHVVRALARRGWRIRVATRRPDLAGFLQPMGKVGQVNLVQANLRYPESLAAAARGADCVVNLVGILQEAGRQRFDIVQAAGAKAVAQAAKQAGANRLVHISAIGADAESDSLYARSKAEGEAGVREIFPDSIIMRPSIVFGPEDDFFNRFAAMARVSPFLPLIGGGETKFQPVFAGDVGEAVARALEGGALAGTTYELGGPEVKSFRELLEYICKVIGRKRLLLPIPFAGADVVAMGTEIASSLSLGLFPPMMTITRDQVKLLQNDNVVSGAAMAEGRTLHGLGINPEAIETIVPSYLYRFRKTGQYERQAI
jgi:uncharacterized protein YbjT (DUF2867 family)